MSKPSWQQWKEFRGRERIRQLEANLRESQAKLRAERARDEATAKLTRELLAEGPLELRPIGVALTTKAEEAITTGRSLSMGRTIATRSIQINPVHGTENPPTAPTVEKE